VARIVMLSRVKAANLPPARRFAEALGRRGHVVDFFSPASPRELLARGRSNVTYRELPIPTRLYLPSPLSSLEREWAWGRGFGRAVRFDHYDLYWAHDPFPLPWIRREARRANRDWVFHSHDLVLQEEASRLARPFVSLERHLAKEASVVICPERTRARVLSERDRLTRPPFVVSNAPTAEQPPDSSYLREWLGEEIRGRIFLYQGGIAAVASFVALVESVRDWAVGDHLVLLGWAEDGVMSMLQSSARGAGVGDRVHFHPPVDPAHLSAVVASADVGIVLSEGGGINSKLCAPNKMGDYLKSGLPVIYRACSGADAIVGDSGIGVRVSTPDAAGWTAAALCAGRMAAEPKTRDTIRRFVENEFNIDVAAREVLDAVDLLLERR